MAKYPPKLTTIHQDTSGKNFSRRIKIRVTQEEIDKAQYGKADGCMIQMALRRDHPEYKNIWVDKEKVRYTDPIKNCIYTYEMHPRGRVMLLKWDSGEKVSPFDLWLRNPVVRERELLSGAMRSKRSHSTKHHGPVPNAKTKEERAQRGRDRIFGRKLWAEELAQVREDLGISVSASQ